MCDMKCIVVEYGRNSLQGVFDIHDIGGQVDGHYRPSPAPEDLCPCKIDRISQLLVVFLMKAASRCHCTDTCWTAPLKIFGKILL